MRKIILLLLINLPIVVYSQTRYVIKGYGAALKSGDKIFLYYKVNDTVVYDSTVVDNQRFLFRGTALAAVQATLSRNDNPQFAGELHDEVNFYIESGTIIISSKDSLNHAQVSGTSDNLAFYELNTTLKPYREKYGAQEDAFFALKPEQQSNVDTAAALDTRLKKINFQIARIELEFIRQHPGSVISLIALNELIKQPGFLPGIEKAYDGLSPALKNSMTGKLLKVQIQSNKRSAIGATAPDFIQPDTSGKPVRLSHYRGKYVLVDFWASWCAPCRAENPNVVAAYHKYKDKNFTIISVSIDDESSKAAWLKAIKADGLEWTQISDLKGHDNAVRKLYGITLIPANVLINPAGKIIAKNLRNKALFDALDKSLINTIK